jgi:hypothetical protein
LLFRESIHIANNRDELPSQLGGVPWLFLLPNNSPHCLWPAKYARRATISLSGIFACGKSPRASTGRFSNSYPAILLIERRHDTVGLIATDILRNSKVWLLDVGLESSMDDGELIATRLLTPGEFSMTAGVNVPFEIEMLEPICRLLPQRMGNSTPSRIAEDRRFAEAVYKVALASGVMDRLTCLDLPDGA